MKMRNQSREGQLGKLRDRYGRRNKEGKGRLLDDLCEEYGYSRKHVIKLLRVQEPRLRVVRRVKGSGYEPIVEVLERVWRAAEQPCGKRLVAALPLWMPYYARHYGRLLPSQQRQMGAVSAATADRLLAPAKAGQRHGLSGTRPGSLLRQQIPIQGEVWDEKRPGFLEADSVAHCGGSMAGEFIWSLVLTDIATTWTEGRAVWNRGWHGVLEQTRDVESGLPFSLLGFDCDNGGEWLNWHLIRYLQQRERPVRVTRSRAYHKDDNAHVEQKNWMWARQLLGYGRMENAQLIDPINALYKEVWGPMQNCFLPSMKLKAKWREGSRWVRRHFAPQTAYDRVQHSRHVSAQKKRQLREWRAELDPFQLARQVEERLRRILRAESRPPAVSAPTSCYRPFSQSHRVGGTHA